MARATLVGDKILLDLDWREVEVAKLIPGYGFSQKQHTLPLTWAAMVQARGLFGSAFVYDGDLLAWAAHEREWADASTRLRQLTRWDTDERDADGLMPFQQVGVNWMLMAGSGLLGDELGCGKTPQAIVWLRETGLLPALVICPNPVKYHWESRFARWHPRAHPYVVDGGTAGGRKVLAQAKDDLDAVVILNYEAVRAFSRLAPYGNVKLVRCQECDPKFGDDVRPTRCHVHPKELNGWGFQAAIIDEIHRAGDPSTQQTRAVWAAVHDLSVRFRWGLTGTPDHVERLWSIMHTVAPRAYPTRSKFMERYALMGWNNQGGLSVVGLRPDTREELYRILDPQFRRMVKAAVLPQLPPIARQVRHVDLTPQMRRTYDALEEQLHTVLPNGQMLITKNKLVARTRLLQLASANCEITKPEDPDDLSHWQVTLTWPSPKVDELDALLDELEPDPRDLSKRFAVACVNSELARMVAERLGERGIKHQLVAGSVHASTVEQACRDLNSGELQALVFTHKKGGTGLDMSGARFLFVLQRSDSLIEEIQTEGRVHRIGSEVHDQVLIVDVVSRGTREEKQVERLYQKLEEMEEIARDRVTLGQELAVTQPSDKNFLQLVAKLDQLNTRQAELLSQDDLDAWRNEEE